MVMVNKLEKHKIQLAKIKKLSSTPIVEQVDLILTRAIVKVVTYELDKKPLKT
jgi:hypothetical protein